MYFESLEGMVPACSSEPFEELILRQPYEGTDDAEIVQEPLVHPEFMSVWMNNDVMGRNTDAAQAISDDVYQESLAIGVKLSSTVGRVDNDTHSEVVKLLSNARGLLREAEELRGNPSPSSEHTAAMWLREGVQMVWCALVYVNMSRAYLQNKELSEQRTFVNTTRDSDPSGAPTTTPSAPSPTPSGDAPAPSRQGKDTGGGGGALVFGAAVVAGFLLLKK